MLTVLQERFVAEYLKNPIGAEAARAAGYSVRVARNAAHKLLKNPEVAAAIAKAQAALAEQFRVDVHSVIDRLSILASSNMADFVSVDDAGKVSLALAQVSRRKWTAVRQIKISPDGTVDLKLYDARAALVDLGKHLGLFKAQMPDADPPGPNDEFANTPARELARRILFSVATQMQAAKSNGAAAPNSTKH